MATKDQLDQAAREGWNITDEHRAINTGQPVPEKRLPIDGLIETFNAEQDARRAGKKRKSTIRDPQGEDLMQIKVIEWSRMPEVQAIYPELAFLHHPPMGGGRSKVEGAHFQRMGVIPGILDLALDVPRGGYHGARGELKFGRNGLSKDQLKMVTFLRAQGYWVEVWWDDWELVASDLEKYLKGLKVRKL